MTQGPAGTPASLRRMGWRTWVTSGLRGPRGAGHRGGLQAGSGAHGGAGGQSSPHAAPAAPSPPMASTSGLRLSAFPPDTAAHVSVFLGGVTSSPAWLLEGHDSLVKGGPQTQKKVQLTRTRDDRRRVTPEIRTKTRPGSLAPRASRGRSQDRMRAVTRPPAAGPSSPSQPGSGEGPGVGVCRCLSLRREGAPRSLGAGLPWDQAQAGPARGAPLCSARRWGARGPERSLICSSTCLVWAQKRGRLRCQM